MVYFHKKKKKKKLIIRDTFPALAGSVQIRYALDEFGSNVMVHCHFSAHEDTGIILLFSAGGPK